MGLDLGTGLGLGRSLGLGALVRALTGRGLEGLSGGTPPNGEQISSTRGAGSSLKGKERPFIEDEELEQGKTRFTTSSEQISSAESSTFSLSAHGSGDALPAIAVNRCFRL